MTARLAPPATRQAAQNAQMLVVSSLHGYIKQHSIVDVLLNHMYSTLSDAAIIRKVAIVTVPTEDCRGEGQVPDLHPLVVPCMPAQSVWRGGRQGGPHPCIIPDTLPDASSML